MSCRAIAVAGCGPCGLAAALLLARQGHAVTLFERFDTPRAIGSGLMIQPTGLAVLRQLGLETRIRSEGAVIRRLHGVAGRRVVLDVRYDSLRENRLGGAALHGIGLHRASLFGALHDAVRAYGVELRTGHTVTGSRLAPEGRVLTFADGTCSEPFGLVVDALGTRTPLAPPTGQNLRYGALWASLDWAEGAGLDPQSLTQRYRRSSTMAGIMPMGPGSGGPNGTGKQRAAFFWSLRADRLQEWKAAGLGAWKERVRALWPELEPYLGQIVDPEQLTFARYAHRTLSRAAEPGLVHIGDAWHSASPQLGQGANMALLDAWALAHGIATTGDLAAGVAAAIAMRRRHVALYQALTWLFTPVYQSDSRLLPLLRDWLVGPISRMRPTNAMQAVLVAGLAGRPLQSIGLDLSVA
jgi:2-polyprenyl-6-methoxyphenol hydroxylase-like FAD-dependent oxidoreductase